MLLKRFRNWIKRNKYIFLAYLTIAIIILLIFIIFVFKRKLEVLTVNDYSFYQYLSGSRFDYDGSITLDTSNKVTKLAFKDVSITLDSTPIYFKDRERVLFPLKMSVIYPLSNGMPYKINGYTQIEKDKLSYYLYDGSLKKNMQNCFLFDGNDLYFFLTETTISFADNDYLVSPFSYVTVRYDQQIEIYDYEKDSYSSFPIGTDEVLASVSGYTINMNIDALIMDNSSRLFVKNIDFLKNLE